MSQDKVIVVEGDPRDRASLHAALAAAGYEVSDSSGAEEALAQVPRAPALGARDRRAPPGGCRGVRPPAARRALRRRAWWSSAPTTGWTPRSPRCAPAPRPTSPGRSTPTSSCAALEKVIERRRLRQEGARLRAEVRGRIAIVGAAPELQQVMEIVKRVAPTKATVLVSGETGVGKEHVAQTIHELSPRRDRPFVRVNCAALSDLLLESELFGHERGAFEDAPDRRTGRLEQADGGTVYLHEVRRLPPSIQVKLLRLLQHGDFERLGGRDPIHVDVRVVAGTHLDLAEEVRAGRFRDDLYYRLNVVSVGLPPLRERKGDIPALVNHFIDLHARALGQDHRRPDARARSRRSSPTPGRGTSASWRTRCSGRSRTRAARRSPRRICRPSWSGCGPDEGTTSALIPGATLFEIEREAILRTLDQVEGSTARAAELLGVSVRKIQYRLKEYRSGHSARRREPEAAHEAGVRRR